MAKKASYQERIISRYYEHQDAIMVQRLGELVSELYLAEGKARTRLWDRAARAMKNLSVPAERIEHIVRSDNPSLVANLVKEMEGRGTRD
jgi:hypothetical protein